MSHHYHPRDYVNNSRNVIAPALDDPCDPNLLDSLPAPFDLVIPHTYKGNCMTCSRPLSKIMKTGVHILVIC